MRAWVAIAAALQGLAPQASPATAARAEGREWAVTAGPRPPAAGSSAGVELHLTARAGFHVNLEYPMAFTPSSGASARFAGARVPLRPASTTACRPGAAEVCAVVLDLPYAPPAQGPARVAGTFAFSVCSAERCLIQKVPLALDAAGPAPGRAAASSR